MNENKMRYRDQKKYFEALRRYERKMTSEEAKDYKMFKKRHTDDEELDTISFEKLKSLYEKYHVNRVKQNLDDLIKFNKPGNNEEKPE